MTTGMLRTIGRIAMGIALVLALVWIGQEAGLFAMFDNPETGAIGFGLLGLMCELFARRAELQARD